MSLKLSAPVRYVLLAVVIIISLHYILSFSHEGYGKATSLNNIKEQLRIGPSSGPPYKQPLPDKFYYPPTDGGNRTHGNINATFVVLARNGDLPGVLTSIQQMEDRFNKQFQYPWTFLNEEPFTDEFKQQVSQMTDAKVEFGLIPKEDWYQPPWIDEDRARKARERMQKLNVIYGGSVPYRNMCRFNSGFFYRQELLQKYKYYWRVEPNVKFFCDVHYDPFEVMASKNAVYGFTVSLFEYEATIPTLWETVREFIEANPDAVAQDNAMAFLSDNGGETYNRCHFWSNFEIGDLDFWRGEEYMKFFNFLDEKGGFYYERWGDAPVHSIGAALFARKDQIHFFEDIGYRHEPFQHCPQGESHSRGRCSCDKGQNFDYEWYSCLKKYDALFQ